MQNNYKNTIKRMILANDNLREEIINNYEIDNETKKIISIELFFLTFTIFLDFFEEIEISEEWKKIIKEQDYYIDKDKIIAKDMEISFESIEMAFIETLLKYNENKSSKIISFDFSKNLTKKSLQEPTNRLEAKIFQYNPKKYLEQKEILNKQAIDILNTYELDKEGKANTYLYKINNMFRIVAYDSIVSLYNELKGFRNDLAIESNLSLLDGVSKSKKNYSNLIYMLLNFYPIQIYAKNRDIIDYSSLLIDGIDADANYYRFDKTFQEFEKEYKSIDIKRNNYSAIIRNRKVKASEKIKVRSIIEQLEKEKEALENKYMAKMINQSDMKEIIDSNNKTESFYSSSLLNKHILYNIENAIRKGYVRIDKDKIVFYSIVDDKVDFIINIYNYMIMDIFDTNNLLQSLNNEHSQNVIKNESKKLYK